jgi:hypothetical protein
MRSQVPVYPTVQCRDQQIESPLPVACHRWGRLSQEPATGSGMLVLCWSPHRWRRYIWIISYMRTYTYIYISFYAVQNQLSEHQLDITYFSDDSLGDNKQTCKTCGMFLR